MSYTVLLSSLLVLVQSASQMHRWKAGWCVQFPGQFVASQQILIWCSSGVLQWNLSPHPGKSSLIRSTKDHRKAYTSGLLPWLNIRITGGNFK